MLRQQQDRARRIVVAGFGPVAARLVDRLRPAVRAHRLQVLVIGAEPVPAYNRVVLGEVATGRTDPAMIALCDGDDYAADGIQVRLGRQVRAIDRERRYVTLDDGHQHAYDTLVLATGAAARIPRLEGLPHGVVDQELPDGVTVLRDLADAGRLRSMIDSGGRLVVLGGGVLGLETALMVAHRGVAVTVVHTGRVPMDRNLDATAAAIVSRHLQRASVQVVADASACRVSSRDGRFTAVLLSDGRRVDGDGLVLCCGAAPRTEVAELAGLRVDHGIVVDHDLRSVSDPRVYALGDCARIRCPDPRCDDCGRTAGPSGLIGPGWAQADRLARRLLGTDDGGPARSVAGPGPVTVLKAPGLSVVSAGRIDADPLDGLLEEGLSRVAQWSDPGQGRYAKMITRDGVLEGMICVGMPRSAAELTLLYEARAELPGDRSALLRHDGPDDVSGPSASADGQIVCRCNGVPADRIGRAIDDGHTDLQAIGRATRAGTGCGTCRDRICELLQERIEAVV